MSALVRIVLITVAINVINVSSLRSNPVISKSDKNIYFDAQTKANSNRQLIGEIDMYQNMSTTTTVSLHQNETVQSMVISEEFIIILIGIIALFLCCACITLISLTMVYTYSKREKELLKIQNNIGPKMTSIASHTPSHTSVISPQSQSQTPMTYPCVSSFNSKVSYSQSNSASNTIATIKDRKFTNESSNVSQIQKQSVTTDQNPKLTLDNVQSQSFDDSESEPKVILGKMDTVLPITEIEETVTNEKTVTIEIVPKSETFEGGFMSEYMNAPISHCRDHKGSIYTLSEPHSNGNIVEQILQAQASI